MRDGPALRNHRFCTTTAVGVAAALAASFIAEAGDILRGGAPAVTRQENAGFGSNPAPTSQARANAKDVLSRTTEAVQAVKGMQAAARDAAIKASNLGLNPNKPGVQLPNVPNGLATGGLQVGNTKLWQGATLPAQMIANGRTTVTIKQTKPQALLNWETFNIGKKTTLSFDQSAGGDNQGQWIAFNKVNDPSGDPSQILGSIEGSGQAYIINQNGIIFGGSSQVDLHTLVASSLLINDGLITRGLLNNPDAHFLFSNLPIAAGKNGTPAFNPVVTDPAFIVDALNPVYTVAQLVAGDSKTPAAPIQLKVNVSTPGSGTTTLNPSVDYTLGTDSAGKTVVTFTLAGLVKAAGAPVRVSYTPVAIKSGDVKVQKGAILASPVNDAGNGGRVMLVGPNVENAGTISTPSGQTIIAAGLQAGVAAHASDDPSLRGLDVWVGAVGRQTGTATNRGLVTAPTGSISMGGRLVNQLGVVESSTSVNLNGRIDLRASYGAVGNPNADTGTNNKPPFVFQETGVVTFGEGSVTTIIPEYASERTVPGTKLPEASQINVEGLAIHFARHSMMLAPSGNVRLRAGLWPYKDTNRDRTTLAPDGAEEGGLNTQFSADGTQRFLFGDGQIYMDASSFINVAGTTDVFVPLAQSILDVEFRGSEFADSPLQRDGMLRATPLTVDIRKTGSYDGRFWMGTGLGDVTGLAGLIQRNAAQLTAAGGSITAQAGGSIVVRDGATIDVSGGFFQNEGGMVKTSRLLQNGHLVEIADALPDQVYDGVYTGQFTRSYSRWGITNTFTAPWMTGGRYEAGYVSGASGGTLSMTAPGMAIDGRLLGTTIEGPRQRSDLPGKSNLSLSFEAERIYERVAPDLSVIRFSPTPPTVVFRPDANQPPPGAFETNADVPKGLPADRIKLVRLSPELFTTNGFGNISIANPDGNVLVAEGVSVAAPAKGSLAVTGSNITIRGSVSAPGGKLGFRVLNLSPSFVEQFNSDSLVTLPLANPSPNSDRGLFTLAPGATLSTAGFVVDDRVTASNPLATSLVLDGGEISIAAYSANLSSTSTIDISGGANMSARGRATYGNGGTLEILTGRDLSLTSVTGGELTLGGTLRGYSGGTGGTLALQAMLVQVGGEARFSNTVVLPSEFFRQGGFTKYSLTGIGRLAGKPSATISPQRYAPAIYIAPDTIIEPSATSLIAIPREAGFQDVVLQQIEKPVGLRSPVSVSLAATGSDDRFTLDVLEARGDVVAGARTRIQTDPGAGIAVSGNTVSVFGSLIAPGGTISIKGKDSFALTTIEENSTPYALPTVHIGGRAVISTAGAVTLLPDAFGRRLGTISDGGVLTVFGNIVAQAGGVLDASGTKGTFDYHPSQLGLASTPMVPDNSGVTAPLWRLETMSSAADSDGGLIELEGSQMLLSDATLMGEAGGPNAKGGTLSIHSGRFYPRLNGNFNSLVRSTDINLVVTQSGNFVPVSKSLGIGRRVIDAAGVPVPGLGYFAIDRFSQGGFDSFDLGAKVLESTTSPLTLGGNIQFKQGVTIDVPGVLRLAAGGVLNADAAVQLNASYIAIGQPFRPALKPEDRLVVFQQQPAGGSIQDFAYAPTFGSGRLEVNTRLLDLGNLSLQKVGQATFDSTGDIRGNGTVAIRGNLTLHAGQIYPTSLATFNLFAYDPANRRGSIVIEGNGFSDAPLSVGGNLNIFASAISQGGTLRAPMGNINVGWDGTDIDRSDADLDRPRDPVSLGALAAPVATHVVLTSPSITSVSALNAKTGEGLLLPFGLSPDGFSWIDPRGVNVTITGLPEKRISIGGVNVASASGSTIDIRGGGELYAFRWVIGNTGSTDILGVANTEWVQSASYKAGDLVSYRGVTYAARTGNTGQKPAVNLFWSRLPESYAIIPEFDSEFAPYNPFNTATARLLEGDPGYVFTPSFGSERVFTSLNNTTRTNQGLNIGEQVFLAGAPGLEAGNYTLLPRGYGRYPGAFLVTPQAGDPIGTVSLPNDATIAQGYRSNPFSKTGDPVLYSRFEVASSEVIRQRVAYNDYLANAFLSEAATRFEINRPQRLPVDGGYLGLHGNVGLSLYGNVLTTSPIVARGAEIDVSSFADIYAIGGRGGVPAGATAVLNTAILESWGAESLLIGGLRRQDNDTVAVDVRTSRLTLNNGGSTFSGPEIILASKDQLTVAGGSEITAGGQLRGSDSAITVSGDGALLRVTSNINATLVRNNSTSSTTALLDIGAGAHISGQSVTLDSSYGSRFDPAASITARSLDLGSGQISIVLSDPAGGLLGAEVTPHLVLSGPLLQDVQRVQSLTLRSYRTIDLYGSGTFGSATLGTLTLSAAGLRGYDQGSGKAIFSTGSVILGNPSNVAALEAPETSSGTLQIDAKTIRFGSNTFSSTGYENLIFNASGGVLGTGSGAFTTPGRLTINTPLISGERGSTQEIIAGGALTLSQIGGAAHVAGGLGASFTFTGATVRADTTIRLPSGEIVLRALNGDVMVGGLLDVSGTRRDFYDLVRYSDAGRIVLTSDTGDVELLKGSRLSVASAGLGKAGSIAINAAKGKFTNAGKANLLGSARSDEDSGSFLLDVLSAGNYASVNGPLQAGGFFAERNIRLRTGSVTIDGVTRARDFTLSADQGTITVTGTIDARGRTGGKIILVSGDSLTLESNSRLTVHASKFNSAGKGGGIRLEAGAAIDGMANELALVDIKDGSLIDLGVDAHVAGSYTDRKSSAFRGQFEGTLHLRAPRVGNDIAVGPILGDIAGASSILVEGFRVYDRSAAGTLDTGLRETIHFDAQNYMDAGYDAMLAKLIGTNDGLNPLLVIAPGIEIISKTGDLILGTDADDYANDWDLSGFRYGPKQAPGVLTIRAAGNVQFKNALSDGFAGDFSPDETGEIPRPGLQLWLRPLMDIASTLPVNTQSWSYRLSAGADLGAADFRRLQPLDTLGEGKGSILVGKFYPPNLFSAAGLQAGNDGTTAAVIDNRFQVIRTGAGNIDIAAGRDVQLRNQFATIYTAGVRLPYANAIVGETEVRLMSVFSANDFAVPVIELGVFNHPDQGSLGAAQQAYAAQYAMAGGDLNLFAQGDIGRFTFFDNKIVADSSRQLPNNWLYRRGFVDPATGRFGLGGIQDSAGNQIFGDISASTTWWVDYSNFFQGVGALGGGNVTLRAGNDVINMDAATPTNARMAGRDAAGANLAPDPANLLELGGGDIVIRAGNDINGGVYYVERGNGTLSAGGSITTNSARSPSLGLLGAAFNNSPDIVQSVFPSVLDSLTWLPTTLFVGKSHFNVSASRDILIGPVINPFFLPQGVNNKFWYKTYFDTYSADAGATVSSFGGSVTHRQSVTLPGDGSPTPVLQAWLNRQNRLAADNASFYEPWIRLAEGNVTNFSTISTVNAPTLHSTAFAGDVRMVGNINLFPSPHGNLELAASQGVIGIQPSGRTRIQIGGQSQSVTAWTSASLNLSDVDPTTLPGITSPLAYQAVVGSELNDLRDTQVNPFVEIDSAFKETGSFAGIDGSAERQRTLHASNILHADDSKPVLLYALGGDITALTLFTPKAARIAASNDISDIAFYIQNTQPESVSLVSAGRDIIPFNENSALRSIASDPARGNVVVDGLRSNVLGTTNSSLAGDIQIGGPGVLEVIAGANLDLGTGANLTDGTGTGITSIGNSRNPFLPFGGSDLIVMAGVSGPGNAGAALGLASSSLDFQSFISAYKIAGRQVDSPYLDKLGFNGTFQSLTEEQQAIVALEHLYRNLRDAGRDSVKTGNYDPGFAAIDTLFGDVPRDGEIFTRTRDLRTSSGGGISIAAPGGGVTMASDIFGNPLTPPGIVSEFGGSLSVFTDESVDIGQARIFTLRGGDIIIWSSRGDIAAGTAPKTVVTAPPTRVLIDSNSADVETDLGGLATGGGIGVLASVEGIMPGNADLIAPGGFVDAGDAGIRATGNLSIAAVAVLNASNITVAGSSTGVPSAPTVAAPNIGNLATASNPAAATNSAAQDLAKKQVPSVPVQEEPPSIITVEVIGYGGGEG